MFIHVTSSEKKNMNEIIMEYNSNGQANIAHKVSIIERR